MKMHVVVLDSKRFSLALKVIALLVLLVQSNVLFAGMPEYECRGANADRIVIVEQSYEAVKAFEFNADSDRLEPEINYYPRSAVGLPEVVEYFEFAEACVRAKDHVNREQMDDMELTCAAIDMIKQEFGISSYQLESLTSFYLYKDRRGVESRGKIEQILSCGFR